MNPPLRFWTCLIAAFAGFGSVSAQTQTRLALMLEHDQARPGDTVVAGIRFRLAPGWHTYWRNPGPIAFPTRFNWTVPAEVEVGEIQWPLPEKRVEDGQLSYIYEPEVVLLVPLKVKETAPKGNLSLSVKVNWLECEKSCVPANGTATAELRVGDSQHTGPSAALIQRFRERLPRAADFPVTYSWAGPDGGTNREAVFRFKPATTNIAEGTWDFFPYLKSLEFAPEAATQTEPDGTVILTKRAKTDGDWPNELNGLIARMDRSGHTVMGLEVQLVAGPPLTMTAKAGGQTGAGQQAATSFTGENPADHSLLYVLGLAFLGGLILNIMPCVLPVIALKILGFVRQSGQRPERVRLLGLMYTVGVLVSFLILAGAIIGVQKAGRIANWGMQFQNPVFVVAMTTLVTLVALNLFGVFEVYLGRRTAETTQIVASREGLPGAFFNGMLATILATPCTAPFLAGALAFAFSQPPAIILLVFLTVGLGLAAPYMLLSFQPQWLKILPKPGAWMERFKVAMGFPMLATAIWLLSVSSIQFGIDGVKWLSFFLLLVSICAWIYGQIIQRGSNKPGIAWVVIALLLIGGGGYILERELNWRNPDRPGSNGAAHSSKPGGISWEPWSTQAVEAAVKTGKPVLVDFTAAWCLVCQLNLRRAIEVPEVTRKLQDLDATALLADYTLEDPVIAEELRRHGRSAVPLVLVYSRKAGVPPRALNVVLSKSEVLAALDWASQP